MAPVAEIQGQLFVDLDTTFAAFARVARPFIQESISEVAGAEDAAIATLPTIRPFLANTAKLFAELQPGFRAIAPVQKDVGRRDRRGRQGPARSSPALNAQLDPTAQSLLNLANNATARQGINAPDRRSTTRSARRSLHHAGAVRLQLRDALFRNAASLASYSDGVAQRAALHRPPAAARRTNSEIGPELRARQRRAAAPPTSSTTTPTRTPRRPGQTRECEAGNEAYIAGQRGDRERPGQPGDPHRAARSSSRSSRARRRRRRGRSDARRADSVPQRKDYDERIYRKGHPPHRMRTP